MKDLRRLRLSAIAAVLLFGYGCGGGDGDPATRLAGVVTDAYGKPVAGASVSCGGESTVSLSNGTFTLSDLPSGIRTVSASISLDGRRYSGETRVDISKREKNRSVNVVVSDDRYQARLTGVVIDGAGYLLEGAKVFVEGPWGSTLGVAGSDGVYDIRRLAPNITYTVTCSLAGYVNDTKTVYLGDSETGKLSFALTYGSDQGTIPAPQNPSSQAWTIADTVTRAPNKQPAHIQWLKRAYRGRRGLPLTPRMTENTQSASTKATPLGSVVEVDLFWTYESWDDLLGYAIKRGTSSPPTSTTAVLRDPLASAFFDVDMMLTPDTKYYYTIHCLDTIGFPATGRVGPASDVVSANPLQPIAATSPTIGDTVSGDPVFRWTSVHGASTYQVVVWDHFPDLQNPDDPYGVEPIWPTDFSSPGASKVSASQTYLTYAGPSLQVGKTYYWLVLAADDGEYALSVSRIMKFTAR
jgi:hypothetical protein